MAVPREPVRGMGGGVWDPNGYVFHAYIHPDYLEFMVELDCKNFEKTVKSEIRVTGKQGFCTYGVDRHGTSWYKLDPHPWDEEDPDWCPVAR